MAKDPSWYVPNGNGPYSWGNSPKPKKQGIFSAVVKLIKGKKK